MTISEVIRAKLLSNGPLSALVGQRIYPLRLPQKPVYPAVVYARMAGDYQSNLAVESPVIQFDCWAEGYTAAETICRALRNVLEREKFISNGLEVMQCTMVSSPIDSFDAGVDKYRVTVDFKINYREV